VFPLFSALPPQIDVFLYKTPIDVCSSSQYISISHVSALLLQIFSFIFFHILASSSSTTLDYQSQASHPQLDRELANNTLLQIHGPHALWRYEKGFRPLYI
jgi:hypothetical protein